MEFGVRVKRVYREAFEDHYLDITRRYNQGGSSEYIPQTTCPAYPRKAARATMEDLALSMTEDQVEDWLGEGFGLLVLLYGLQGGREKQ